MPTAVAVAQPAQSAADQANAARQNFAARSLILRGGMVGDTYFPPAINMWQPLNPSLPTSPAPASVITFNLRNVGLVKRLILRIKATVTAGATYDQALTAFGLANFFSTIVFTDLGNNQRINTYGWHLTALSSAKRRGPFAAAYTTDTPLGYGNINNRVMYAPASITATQSSEIDFLLEIPFVKNDGDLRGAIYADVTNANMQVQCTINPNMFVSSTADATLAMYQSAGNTLGSLSNLTIQCYQNYLDQLPRSGGLPILPKQDIATAYLLNNTASVTPTVNQDNGNSFVNARSYESVTWFYDNNGTLNINGSDYNSIQLTSANFTNIYNWDGRFQCFMDRNVIGDDFPKAMHYLDFSARPIDTNQYGNMQLVLNPNSVGGSSAFFGFGWEAFGIIGLVNQGGSLPMGS